MGNMVGLEITFFYLEGYKSIIKGIFVILSIFCNSKGDFSVIPSTCKFRNLHFNFQQIKNDHSSLCILVSHWPLCSPPWDLQTIVYTAQSLNLAK